MIIGAEEPAVIVQGRFARLLVKLLEPQLEHYARREGVHWPPDFLAIIGELRRARDAYAAHVASCASETSETVLAEPPAIIDDDIGTSAVADRLGCTEQYVRKLARRGTIAGRRTATGWRFDPVDVNGYVAHRATA